jgi:ribosomal protein L32
MEPELSCIHCSRSGWASKAGLNYHQVYCKRNPDRREPHPKSEAFYSAMRNRRGNSKNQWSKLNWNEVPFDQLSRTKRRERLLEENNYSCSMCGYNRTRECGGSILEIDHIDGDHTNSTHANLRVLCPNCHALTPNFRNWGRKGRNKTSKRIRKGNKDFNKT